MSINYGWSLKWLPSKINSIVEVGSRDALDAIFLSEFFGCECVAFEPNPTLRDVCTSNISTTTKALVTLRTEALSNENKFIDFMMVDTDRYANSGASGFFEIDFANRSSVDKDHDRDSIQIPVKVASARWDSLCLPTPELLVMDCEGAELMVLMGFGDALKDVNYIVLEVSHVAIGRGACTFRQVDKFLRVNGYKFVASSIWSDRYLYLKFRLLLSAVKKRIKEPLGRTKRGRSFDVVYWNAKDSGT
jgi:FkbM family methyltransferase